MDSLLSGYRFYKSVQGTVFNNEDLETKNKIVPQYLETKDA